MAEISHKVVGWGQFRAWSLNQLCWLTSSWLSHAEGYAWSNAAVLYYGSLLPKHYRIIQPPRFLGGGNLTGLGPEDIMLPGICLATSWRKAGRKQGKGPLWWFYCAQTHRKKSVPMFNGWDILPPVWPLNRKCCLASSCLIHKERQGGSKAAVIYNSSIVPKHTAEFIPHFYWVWTAYQAWVLKRFMLAGCFLAASHRKAGSDQGNILHVISLVPESR